MNEAVKLNSNTNDGVTAGIGDPKPAAALYLRGEETDLAALKAQAETCASYAAASGYRVASTYVDGLGDGASLKDRLTANGLIEAAKGGAFQIVVVEGVEALSRALPDALDLCSDLDGLGVELHTVRAGRLAVPPACVHPGPVSVEMRREVGRWLDRMQAGRRRAADQGRMLRLPYGYRRDAFRAGRHHVDSEAASVVRHIFDRLAAGASCAEVAGELAADDVPPPPTPGGGSQPRWTARRIEAIRRNRTYIGEVVWCRTSSTRDETGRRSRRAVAPERWTVRYRTDLAIVDREVWEKAAQSRPLEGKA